MVTAKRPGAASECDCAAVAGSRKYCLYVIFKRIQLYTPDGKVAVVEAIGALMGADRPEIVWGRLKEDYPQLKAFYEEYEFDGSVNQQVTDSTGWEVIEGMLSDYILDQEAPGRQGPKKGKQECLA